MDTRDHLIAAAVTIWVEMTQSSKDRYSRQILFAGIGEAGQQKLLDARVAIVGCGALGSFQAGALARAGAGFLRIIDRDYVELSNLQRQWLFEETDAAEALPKPAAAARRIAAINSSVQVDAVSADLTSGNIDDLLGEVDLVLDGTDNFETRYLMNDFCVSRDLPWVYGAAVASYGITMSIVPGRTACLKCIYPEPPSGVQPTCETAGVLGPITSAIASLQVAAAMRILSGLEPLPKITTVDVWSGEMRQIDLPPPDPQCAACGRRDFMHLAGVTRAPISLCGRNAVQIHEHSRHVDLGELSARLAPLGEVRHNDFALRFETPPYQLTVFPDGRVIVKGTTDTAIARSVYARYIGA
ncbi:MAG TPA: ThiF family adenylyltransferase [Bryobacteraceae bacterium]|nr:ThiF family adenylyltransferase [Bryobacteraceae bacterium]